FLAQAGDLTPAQLAEVLRVDQRERWQAGEPVPAEAYLRQYPRLREHADGLLNLVYNEFRLRDQRGEAPAPAEYLARFPDHAEALQPLLELHQAMAASSAAAPSPLPLSPEYRGEGKELPPSPLYSGERGRGEGAADFLTDPAPEGEAAGRLGVPGYEVL